jgi:hypothetical protein
MSGRITPPTWYLGARHYQLEVTDSNWIPVHLSVTTRAYGGSWHDTASIARDCPPATGMTGRTCRRRYPWPVDRDHQRPNGPSPHQNRDDPRIPGFETPHDPYRGYV